METAQRLTYKDRRIYEIKFCSSITDNENMWVCVKLTLFKRDLGYLNIRLKL